MYVERLQCTEMASVWDEKGRGCRCDEVEGVQNVHVICWYGSRRFL